MPTTESGKYRAAKLRAAVQFVFYVYMTMWHRMRIDGLQHVPREGPLLVLVNHTSILDVIALMAVDPYNNASMVAKASLFRVPLVSQVIGAWGGIPVDREGRDFSGVRAVLTALRQKRVVIVAAEGKRSRTGHLEPINPVLAKLAANAGVPLLPIGISGTFKALPPGAKWPRPRQVRLRVGTPFLLSRDTPAEDAALAIQRKIAALLPADQQPLD